MLRLVQAELELLQEKPTGPGRTLQRRLGLWSASLTGIGVILGAGIYALVGPAAGQAGGAIWLSFLVAALIAGLTGYSYARFVTIVPKNSPEFQYASVAFGPTVKSNYALNMDQAMFDAISALVAELCNMKEKLGTRPQLVVAIQDISHIGVDLARKMTCIVDECKLAEAQQPKKVQVQSRLATSPENTSPQKQSILDAIKKGKAFQDGKFHVNESGVVTNPEVITIQLPFKCKGVVEVAEIGGVWWWGKEAGCGTGSCSSPCSDHAPQPTREAAILMAKREILDYLKSGADDLPKRALPAYRKAMAALEVDIKSRDLTRS